MENKTKMAASLLVAFAAGAAHAQVRPAYSYPGESGRGAVNIAGTPLYITPYVGLGIGRDDNVLLQPNNERSSTYWVLSPGFMIDARTSNVVFLAKYQASIGRYAQSDDDNYVDHAARTQFDFAFDRRNFLRVGLDWVRGHDPRGSTDRAISNRPDIYRLTSPNVTYAFGAPGARGRVEVYAAEADRRYLNNRAITQFSDREVLEYGGVLYIRAAPKTYVLAEVRQSEIAYRLPNASNGEERRFFGGVSWEATAATTGTIKAGRLERESDIGVEDSATSWEASVSWAPRTYSKFDFATARTTTESTGLGRFILSSIAGVTWTHAWNSYLSTGVDFRYQKDQYQGFPRTDETRTLGLKAGYKFRRWLTLGAEFSHSSRDSNLPSSDYDKNLYLLTATASM
ncbi:MAG TPA: outer membrane beta-barrel protein [Usitatibacter sp.]|nr:outer membrane beta-barrel protein [Usitatibacter sp.]